MSDRIRESVDIFGSQPERLGSIMMTAVTALALLISKVLDKARELSAKFFEKEVVQTVTEPSGGRTTQIIPQTDKPPKPVMSAEAAAYPKLLKIYIELSRQNGIIFDAERERNELELERDSLKGFARLTKKKELQNRERYGKSAQKREESLYSRLQNYQRESTNRQTRQSSKNMGRGER